VSSQSGQWAARSTGSHNHPLDHCTQLRRLETLAFFCCFQDRQVVGANLRLASESPLLVQARRIALGDRTPVVLANLGSDRYHPGSLASEWPVLVVRWGLRSSAGDYSGSPVLSLCQCYLRQCADSIDVKLTSVECMQVLSCCCCAFQGKLRVYARGDTVYT
jgi:hypothetical protein